MLDEVRLLDEIDGTQYTALWDNLTGVTEAELDWQPHARANSVRWVLGHSVWFEEWVANAIHGTGTTSPDERPTAYRLNAIGEIRQRFDAARDRCAAAVVSVTAEDLHREVDYFGRPRPLRQVLVAHTTHLTGSRYQIRYIRGTYSRAHGTDKAAFDPW